MRFGTVMRFDITDLDIDAVFEQGMRLLEHPVGFAHPGTHPDIDLKLTAPGAFDHFQEMFNRLFFVFFCHYLVLPGKACFYYSYKRGCENIPFCMQRN